MLGIACFVVGSDKIDLADAIRGRRCCALNSSLSKPTTPYKFVYIILPPCLALSVPVFSSPRIEDRSGTDEKLEVGLAAGHFDNTKRSIDHVVLANSLFSVSLTELPVFPFVAEVSSSLHQFST